MIGVGRAEGGVCISNQTVLYTLYVEGSLYIVLICMGFGRLVAASVFLLQFYNTYNIHWLLNQSARMA